MHFEKQDITGNAVLFFPYDIAQAEISWVGNGDKYNASNSALVELFNTYFGRGMGSLVFQTIRESKALAYIANAVYESPTDSAGRYSMLAFVGTQADKLDEAVSAMDQLLATLPESQTALSAIKENMKNTLVNSRLPDDAVIFDYLRAKRLGINEDMRKMIFDKLEKINFGNLDNFHRRQVSGRPYIYTVIGPTGKINIDDLRRLGDVKQLTAEEIFGY